MPLHITTIFLSCGGKKLKLHAVACRYIWLHNMVTKLKKSCFFLCVGGFEQQTTDGPKVHFRFFAVKMCVIFKSYICYIFQIIASYHSNRLGSNSKSSKSEVSTTSSIVISLYVRSNFIDAG